MTNSTQATRTRQAHNIIVRDFTPGTGIHVAIHKRPCGCGHVVGRRDVIQVAQVAASEDPHRLARIVARGYGLNGDDYVVSDCALF